MHVSELWQGWSLLCYVCALLTSDSKLHADITELVTDLSDQMILGLFTDAWTNAYVRQVGVKVNTTVFKNVVIM
jgi:hypothetical protein